MPSRRLDQAVEMATMGCSLVVERDKGVKGGLSTAKKETDGSPATLPLLLSGASQTASITAYRT